MKVAIDSLNISFWEAVNKEAELEKELEKGLEVRKMHLIMVLIFFFHGH